MVNKKNVHTFHVPVMGTGFTIDTPLRVAKYGISSVLSLVDDVLIEQMRKFHCKQYGEPYQEISSRGEDSRARRITAYLDLLDRLTRCQMESLRASPFEEGSEITRYFLLLPECPVKQLYYDMIATDDQEKKSRMQGTLRNSLILGNIDVNIMTKLDGDSYRGTEKLPAEYSDAMTALRGYANSGLRSSIIFSAGLNPRLYSYISQFDDFFPDETGVSKKKIVLKVSDYRSALVQGKFLAKKGLWVSEYRIESGLNCGGHTFPSDGYLLGPILEEFKEKRGELIESVCTIYSKAIVSKGKSACDRTNDVCITVQGGIGTAAENEFLLKYYKVNGTGWGTPFLLVPEVANLDDVHIEKLLAVTDHDVYLSDSSPLGVPFWNLRTSKSEEIRRQRNKDGNPGSPCPKRYLAMNLEFTDRPICVASRDYIKHAFQKLSKKNFTEEQLQRVKEGILGKSCICNDLAGAATVKNGIDPNAVSAVCCGQNIVNFRKIATLEEMVGHIYGRLSLFDDTSRSHMFTQEIKIYIEYLRSEMDKFSLKMSSRTQSYFQKVKENLLAGIDYYKKLADEFIEKKQEYFLKELKILSEEIEHVFSAAAVEICVENS